MSHSLDARETAPRNRAGRAVLGFFAVVVPLAVAVVLSGPRLWHSVNSEPSTAVGVASLPAQQPAAATQLPAERPPSAARGQLASLDRFAARDPFAAPLVAPAADTRPAALSPPSVAPLSAPAVTAAPAPAVTAAPAAAGAPTLSAATISINGVPEAIGLNALFPAANPLFRLVALGAGEVQIGVVGRPAAAGGTAGVTPSGTEQTVTLVQGRPLTLLDTSSGARYELLLIALT